MKSTMFCEITPCGPLKVNQFFGGIYFFHHQGRTISGPRNQHESMWQAELLFLPQKMEEIYSCEM
jgi:hypothetical protein